MKKLDQADLVVVAGVGYGLGLAPFAFADVADALVVAGLWWTLWGALITLNPRGFWDRL